MKRKHEVFSNIILFSLPRSEPGRNWQFLLFIDSHTKWHYGFSNWMDHSSKIFGHMCVLKNLFLLKLLLDIEHLFILLRL